MIKLALIGTENSHARAFTNIIYNGHAQLGGVPYADIKIIGLCGTNPDENKLLQEMTHGDAEISDDPHAWVGKADAVMVTCRHGAKHYPSVKPYIEAGTPAFIDKPITIDPAEAIELVKLAKEKNVPICGGSTCGFVDGTQSARVLKKKLEKVYGGSVSAPVSLKNEYGDFFFYSQHLVQIMTQVFGTDIDSIIAVGREDAATFIARYADYDVTGHYGSAGYSATIYEKSQVFHKDIDLAADSYLSEFRRFEHMVRTGGMPESYEDLIAPVFILNAIYESINTGKEVKVQKFSF